MYMQKANIIFVVFDMTDKNSFESLDSWIQMIYQNCTDNTVIKVLANKSEIGLISSQ